MPLTANKRLRVKGVGKTSNALYDGATAPVFSGALLQESAAGNVPYTDGDNFAGIAIGGYTTVVEGPVYTDVEIDGLTVAVAPAVGADVYSTTDDIDNLTTAAGANIVGRIIAIDLAGLCTVRFKI